MDEWTLLETPRLKLCWAKADDEEEIVGLWTDPDVTRHAGGARDEAKVRAAVREEIGKPLDQRGRYVFWCVFERAAGRYLGDCGLLAKEIDGEDEIELNYFLRTDAWGRGYATEAARAVCDHAFSTLGLDRLVALIHPENAASARVVRKLGFGLDREVLRPSGKTLQLWAREKILHP